MNRRLLLLLIILSCAAPVPSPAVDTIDGTENLLVQPHAFQPGPPPAAVRLRLEPVATGLEQPIYVTTSPAGSRLFIIERTGRIRVVENGDLRADPLLDLRADIDWMGERGLLGLAFAPDYAQSGRFYVVYSEKGTCATVVARYRADVSRAVGDPTSREEILRIEQTPERIDHKAGWIGFRPGEPNFLYITSGDGGGHHDPDNVAQNLRERRGKILRVDVSGNGPGFAVPPGNPFVGREDALPEIWAYGVRNPFRASFDRETGDLWFGDVGEDSFEELNYEPAGVTGGRNYGWRLVEGYQRARVDADRPVDQVTPPILAYSHQDMMFLRGCVIGGYVYRGSAFPELRGAYLFADFTNARLYSLRNAQGKVSDLTDWTPQVNMRGETLAYSGLVSLGEDARGELYLVDFAGAVFKVVR